MKKCRQGRLSSFQSSKFHQTYKLESSSETLKNLQKLKNFHEKIFTGIIIWNMHVKFESIWEVKNFSWKNADRASYFMKIPYLFKVHQISSNLQNLIYWNHHLKHACEKLSPFREVEIFHEKMPTVPAIEILWNFHIFSKFIKFHQTYRIYWNHHLKHTCEIWVHSERLKCFMKKCRQSQL